MRAHLPIIGLFLACFNVAGGDGQTTNSEIMPGVYRVGTTDQVAITTNLNELWSGVWKEGTNGLRDQIDTVSEKGLLHVLVSVGSISMNSGSSFFTPPNGKIGNVELRNAAGSLVHPKSAGRMGQEFPAKIMTKSMPTVHWGNWPVGGGSGLTNNFAFKTNFPPPVVKQFAIQDLYQINVEGDYILSVCPVIYKFGTNTEYLDRIDLPCLSTNVHLAPPPE